MGHFRQCYITAVTTTAAANERTPITVRFGQQFHCESNLRIVVVVLFAHLLGWGNGAAIRKIAVSMNGWQFWWCQREEERKARGAFKMDGMNWNFWEKVDIRSRSESGG